jgi:DNA-binding response OmpR family regulator
VGPLILVVDDERALADALVGFLEDEGYRVSVARDGLTGFELALRQAPTLILSDVQMPHLDGRALVNRLRAVGYTMPVVLMSAVFSQPDLPGVRYIAKPFDLDHLLQVLEQTLQDT